MFTSLNSTINRTQAVISLNALCTLVFRTTIRGGSALTAISRWHSLDYNTVDSFISSTLAYSEHLYMKVPAGYDMTEEQLLCARAHIKLCKFPVNVILFVAKSSTLLLYLASD